MTTNNHYFAAIGRLPEDMKFFSNESDMFKWIGDCLGFSCQSYEDIRWWNKARMRNSVDVWTITNLKTYYALRKLYMRSIWHCMNLMRKAQTAVSSKRRSYYLSKFEMWNNYAWHLAEEYAGVWQGEI